MLNYGDNASKTILNPSGWYKAIDYPNPLSANKTDNVTPHDNYTALSESAKEAMKGAKLAKFVNHGNSYQDLCSHRSPTYRCIPHGPAPGPNRYYQDPF